MLTWLEYEEVTFRKSLPIMGEGRLIYRKSNNRKGSWAMWL